MLPRLESQAGDSWPKLEAAVGVEMARVSDVDVARRRRHVERRHIDGSE